MTNKKSSRECDWLLLLTFLSFTGCGHWPETPVANVPPSQIEAPPSPPAPERGRQVYRAGTSTAGRPIAARYGEPPVVVAAPVMVCENCHGEDGIGRPEGGIQPTDITWEALSKPYGTTTAEGRRRPPYTEETLRRAITLGFDSGGAALGAAMPRYQLTRDELDDLVAYIKTLGNVRDPGLTDEALSIGVILAPSSTGGEPVRDALVAFFDRLNEQGGIYGRRIEILWAESPALPLDRARALTTFLDRGPVFALVSPFAVGIEAELVEESAHRKIPIIGPLIPDPNLKPGNSESRYVFYLDAGFEGQARALVRFSAEAHGSSRPLAAILYLEGAKLLPVVGAVRDESRQVGWRAWQEVSFRSDGSDFDRAIGRLQEAGVAVVLAIGLGDQAGRLMNATADVWKPELLVPGSLVGRGIFDPHPRFGGRVIVALPSLPTDQTPEAVEEYRDLASRRSLSPGRRGTHWSVLASARLLVEGLRRSGRKTSRERLVTSLESLREFRTGYAPPLTFGPRRRIGAQGAYLVEVAPATGQPTPIGGWQDVSHR